VVLTDIDTEPSTPRNYVVENLGNSRLPPRIGIGRVNMDIKQRLIITVLRAENHMGLVRPKIVCLAKCFVLMSLAL